MSWCKLSLILLSGGTTKRTHSNIHVNTSGILSIKYTVSIEIIENKEFNTIEPRKTEGAKQRKR